MHQSTLAMLSHGYAISITVIGGTEDEVEDLIDTLDFIGSKTNGCKIVCETNPNPAAKRRKNAAHGASRG